MFEDIRKQRIEKINQLRELGVEPYPSKVNRDIEISKLLENYERYKDTDTQLWIVGRVTSWRSMGKIIFFNILDGTAKIQIFVKVKDLDDKQQKILNLIDTGDFVQVRGVAIITKTGEKSIKAIEILPAVKSIRPLPEKWQGVKDEEILSRKKYIVTTMQPEVKSDYELMAKLLFKIRQFLYERGYLEIPTPMLQPLYGGTNATPFVTKVKALGVDFYLPVSHELYLKRLVAGGFEKVFNLNGYFRNEGIDRSHNPEFHMVETMCAYANYEYNMELFEEMIKFLAMETIGRLEIKIQGNLVNLGDKWRRVSMVDIVKESTGYDFSDRDLTIEKCWDIIDALKIEKEKPTTIGECLVLVYEEKAQINLIAPTIVFGHPVEISPLCKSMSHDSRYVERFEVVMGGIELGDNWTELNDPLVMLERFREQAKMRTTGKDDTHPFDIDFIEMLEFGMPPTTGLGPGIERLAMLFGEKNYIDDILFFPLMKPAPVTDLQKRLYID